MPKKTRKKTIQKTSPKAGGKTVGAPAKTATKKPAAKARPVAAKKTAKTAKAVAVKSGPKKPKADPSISTSPTAALTEGAKAPAFRLPRDGGQTVSLADYAGQKLVLFFYPRAGTPGCTKEAIDFTRLAASFAKAKTAVIGVSADLLKAQESFRNKHGLTVPLVSDEQSEMLKAYGAWGEKSMYGKVFQGVLRTTVLIGANGRILRIWRHVKVDGHADEVLEAAQAV